MGWTATVALLAAPGVPLAAQGLELIPQVGLYAPLADLADVDGRDGAVRLGARESSLALGFTALLGTSGGFGVRGSAVLGTASDIPLEGPGCEGCRVRSSLYVLGAAAVFRPWEGLLLLRPYLVGGFALKRHDFDDDDVGEAGLEEALTTGAVGSGHVGVGLQLDLGLFRGFLEASDYIARYTPARGSGKLQHDLFLLVGLGL